MDENPLPILRDGTPLEYRFPLCVCSTLCEFVIPQLIMAMPPSTRVLWMGDWTAAQLILPDTLSWDYVTEGSDWFSDMRILKSERVMATYDIIWYRGFCRRAQFHGEPRTCLEQMLAADLKMFHHY